MESYFIYNVFDVKGGVGIILRSDAIEDEDKTYYIGRKFFEELAISKGSELSAEAAEKIEREHTRRRAVYKALDLLSLGDMSVSRLKRKLIEKGFDKESAEAAALFAEKKGYIKENEQAERLAQDILTYKLRGKKRIASELYEKGYTKCAIAHALSQLDEAEIYSALCRLINKKYKAPASDRKETEKRISALLRAGFDIGDIKRALNENDFDESEDFDLE